MTSPPVFERVLVGLVTAVCLVPTVVMLRAVGWSAVPSAVSQGCLIAAGVLLWRGPTRREGLSLLAAAALLGLSAMGTDTFAELGGYWLELGWLAFWAAVPPIAYVVLAHPQGRLGLRRHRWLLAAIGLWAVGLQGLRASTWDPAFRGYTGPAQWTSWWPSEVADQRLLWVQTGVCVVVSVWAIVECVVRWRGAEGLVRVPVRWCSGAGIALGVGVLVRQMAFGASTADLISPTMIDILGWVHLLLLAIAVAVLVGIGVREAVRRGEVGEAVLRAAGDPAAVEQILRVRLLDPQLHVAFTINGQRVGADGRALAADDLPAANQDRHVLRSDADGSPLVTVDLARHASADPALLRAALEAAAAALDNGRLNLEREIHLAEISASRARIVESGVTQRRQLERDLHDGAQQHLLAVSANLARAERLADGDRVVGAIDDAKVALRVALDELRRLARGVHPAALSQHGLHEALDGLAASIENLDLRVSDDLSGDVRFDPAVEATVYFVVAEAVTNARKHAADSRVCVELSRGDGCLRVRVSDRGPGGARLEPGGGLAGIRDRVRALGGELHVSSDPGGSLVEAVVPEKLP